MNLDEFTIIRPATPATVEKLQHLGAKMIATGDGLTFADWCATPGGCEHDTEVTLPARWALLSFAGKRLLVVLARSP